jgi:hypothetical protein
VLRDFLTSATLKDCGVMVAMQSVELPHEQAEGLVAQAEAADCFEACGKRICVALLPPPPAAAAAPGEQQKQRQNQQQHQNQRQQRQQNQHQQRQEQWQRQQQQPPAGTSSSGLQSLEEAAAEVAGGAARVLLVSDAADGAAVSSAFLFQVITRCAVCAVCHTPNAAPRSHACTTRAHTHARKTRTRTRTVRALAGLPRGPGPQACVQDPLQLGAGPGLRAMWGGRAAAAALTRLRAP